MGPRVVADLPFVADAPPGGICFSGRRGAGSSNGDSAEPGPDYVLREPFTEATMTALRHAVARTVADTGMAAEVPEDFVLAVRELVTNAVRHGGGNGVLSMRTLAEVLVCEVIDHGEAAGNLPVRLSQTNEPGGRRLWWRTS